MHNSYDKNTEPPSAVNVQFHQHKDSDLFDFEGNLSPRVVTLVMSAITMESLRRFHSEEKPYIPKLKSSDPDETTGLVQFSCKLDLDHLLIVMNTIKKSKRASEKAFDVFISYASQDLEYVKELVAHLEDLGIHVWFDKSQVQWGDQFQAKIDEGILHSRFFLPVISKHYIDKHKSWTRTELYGACNAKNIQIDHILPLLLDVSFEDFSKFSTTLVAQHYMDATVSNPTQIAVALLHMLQDDSDYAS